MILSWQALFEPRSCRCVTCDTGGGANLYSLIEICKANGVDAYLYLIALFNALPLAKTAEDYEVPLHWRFKDA